MIHRRALRLLPLALWSLVAVVPALTAAGCSERRSKPSPLYRNVPSVYGLLQTSYLRRSQIPSDSSGFATVDSLILALNDPYTYERDATAIANATQGTYTGSKGFTVATVGTQVYVATVDPAGPAWREGLRPEDIVLAIDGTAVSASSPNLSSLLSAPSLTLDVERTLQPLSFAISSETYTSVAVVDSSIDADTHYIAISQFFAATQDPGGPAGEVRAILAAYPQVTRWIIDLRWNGGGSLFQACEIADLFAPAGTLVELSDWTGQVAYSCQALSGDPAESTQVAVLLNGASASASEILAAALHDLRGALLVGEQSYGKGVAQTPFDYVDDPRQLLLVTFSVTGPSGTSWDGVGLTPDVPASLDPVLLEQGLDSQVLAAVNALNAATTQPQVRSRPPAGPVVGPAALRGLE